MQFENSQGLPINDSLWDDIVYKVTKSDPGTQILLILWLQVMYHQRRTKGSSSMKVISTYAMNRTSLESALTAYSGDVYRQKKESRL